MSEIEQTKHAVNYCEKIIRRYNPENDTNPNGPMVTWAEYSLAEAIKTLADAIDELTALKSKKPKKNKWHSVKEKPMKRSKTLAQ